VSIRFLLPGFVVVLLAVTADGTQAKWKEFTWAEGKCAILLPGTPKERKNALELIEGEGIYLLSYHDIKGLKEGGEDLVKKIFDGTRDELLKSFGGKLLSEKKLTLGKHPGRELQVEVKALGVYRVRVYLVGERMYQIIVMGPKALTDSKETEKLLESFKLTK
jgi:hypothetical protein